MTKNILLVLPLLCSIALMVAPFDAYAHNGHNHKNGSGCSSCTPPTLGVDANGKKIVSGGITIVDQTYDVDMFKQDLNPEILKVGEPAEITLKIYEDAGYDALKHVELSLGYEERFLSGVLVPYNPVTIEWEKTFDGMTTVTEFNKHSLVKDISVSVVDNSPIIGIKFTFTPTQEFDANTIVVKMWDQKRNASMNYFHNALNIISDNPSVLLANSETSIDQSSDSKHVEITAIESPVDQVNKEIECKTGQVRLLRASNMSPVCVSEYQSTVLIENNWAVPHQ